MGDPMSSVVISGDTSGSVTLDAPAISGNTVLTLPTTSGTILTTAGGATVPFALGSASTPSITFTGDTNTGIFSPTADTIAFAEGGAEVARFDSAGNLGIGTTNPAAFSSKLAISGNSGTGTTQLFVAGGGNAGDYGIVTVGTSTTAKGRLVADADNGNFRFDTAGSASGNMVFLTGSSYTERMRIDSAGRVTMPSQPAFLAHNDGTTGSNGDISGGAVLNFFRATKFNIGNHFNTSTSTFTAPIAGRYQFNAVISCRTNGAGIVWVVNGSEYVLGTDVAMFEASTATMSPNSHIVLSLAANDTVRLQARSGTITIGRHHSWFSGQLIG
jgi:hypothetical protein